MSSIHCQFIKSLPRFIILSLFTGFSMPILADSEGVPAEVLDLLPAPGKITQQDGSTWKDEYTDGFSWQMGAKWPSKYPDCYASRYNSEIYIEIKGDWEWATEAMMEQLTDMYNESLDSAREAMAEDLPSSIYPQSKGKSWEEDLPNGMLFVTELSEDCDGRPNSNLAKVRGYALRGPSTLEVILTVNASAADARVMVVGILDKFERLDLKALTQ